MYVPSDDTFLLAECVKQYSGSWALEIGVGSGVVLDLLEKCFSNVVGSDIDLQALEYCKRRSDAMLICCDAAPPLGIKFDLVVSNPPYLPDDKMKDKTVHGGPTGIETSMHFVRSALPLLSPTGKILLVVSSITNTAPLDMIIKQKHMHKKIIRKTRLFYETLSVIEMSS